MLAGTVSLLSPWTEVEGCGDVAACCDVEVCSEVEAWAEVDAGLSELASTGEKIKF